MSSMAAPVAPRPATFHKDEVEHGFFNPASAAIWAKWVAAVVGGAGICALLIVAIVSWHDSYRVEQARRLWDELYKATKDKTANPEEHIAALESVAVKVKGSVPHAYVLMELAGLYFDQAVDPAKSPEDRSAALGKATSLYKLVADTEPYSSNTFFGPLAIEGEALALEQALDYDAGIAFLEEKLPLLENPSYFAYNKNKMSAQLARLYWLRYQKKHEPKDREVAQTRLAEILRTEDSGKWYDQAKYIKSLVDKHGKALPEGTPVPPVKPTPPPSPLPQASTTPPPKTEPKAAEKAEPKKDEAKKDEAKKDAPKKEDEKK